MWEACCAAGTSCERAAPTCRRLLSAQHHRVDRLETTRIPLRTPRFLPTPSGLEQDAVDDSAMPREQRDDQRRAARRRRAETIGRCAGVEQQPGEATAVAGGRRRSGVEPWASGWATSAPACSSSRAPRRPRPCRSRHCRWSRRARELRDPLENAGRSSCRRGFKPDRRGRTARRLRPAPHWCCKRRRAARAMALGDDHARACWRHLRPARPQSRRPRSASDPAPRRTARRRAPGVLDVVLKGVLQSFSAEIRAPRRRPAT